MSLPRNRPHVFANHLVVTGSHVADVCPDNEHVARITQREFCFVGKADTEIQHSVFDGIGYEIHDLAVNFRVFPAKPRVLLLDRVVDPSAFFCGDGGLRANPRSAQPCASYS